MQMSHYVCMQHAYDRKMQPACRLHTIVCTAYARTQDAYYDRMQGRTIVCSLHDDTSSCRHVIMQAYDRMQPAYDRMHAAYARMQGVDAGKY